jgi:L-aspartate oxidase
VSAAPAVARRLAPTPAATRHADVVVLGTGAAGLAVALRVADTGLRVLVVTKDGLGDGATSWAQGGLAATLAPGDTTAAHVDDTLVAGAGLCDVETVRSVVRGAPHAIERLLSLGARFDRRADGVIDLGLEGGHRAARIVHAGGDASGAEVVRVLAAALRTAVDAGRVERLEHTTALDARLDATGRVDGVSLLTADGVATVACRALVLATGGLGQAFGTTTNPAGATGDGLALAVRAGAVATDVEFVQFHPTMLVPPGGPVDGDRGVLVSEAVRGEGAVLVDPAGRRVMPGIHPLADLAPRDVVSAAMHAHVLRTGDAPLLLDGTSLGRATWERRFPTILALCRARGVDPVREPVPVAPAAHYSCGGVRAALDGTTCVPGLLAVGEVAATGLHGANRLASNSITEALVAGDLAGRRLAHELGTGGDAPTPSAPAGPPGELVDPVTRESTARAVAAGAGVLREPSGLEALLRQLADVGPGGVHALERATVEATNLHTVSVLVATAAAARTESRGCHRRSDVTAPVERWRRHLRLRLEPTGTVAVLPTPQEAAA